MRILGIETSCDDTGIAIYDSEKGLLYHETYNQKKLHLEYGGVVPELASREHTDKVISLIQIVMQKTNIKYSDIDGIAYTAGPGLKSSLIIGATVACSLGYAWKIPVIPVNHLEGHILSSMLEDNKPSFPFIALIVSGANTQIISVYNFGQYKIEGETIDNSVGEVFDKIAKLLNIDYPGGSALSTLAKLGVPERFIFPKPMLNNPDLLLSFSGLKSSVMNIIKSIKNLNLQIKADIARSFEDTIIEILKVKCKKVLDITGFTTLVVVGGVSANDVLRKNLFEMIKTFKNGKIFFVRKEFCTDNAAMIAYTGMKRFKMGLFLKNLEILIRSKWSLREL